ncbi:hypothetical protein BBJ28_00012082 [Nothophytophthora sp. Chile5]|nr:hypothetical protein BBJ28_00012082 [Nothophytophthora sp. Chile5]
MPKCLTYLWNLLRRPFQDCTNCYVVCDSDYYRNASPGVRQPPQQLDRWDRDVKYDFTQANRPVSSNAPSSGGRPGTTHRSKTSSDSYYSYEEDEQPGVQFLFYGGSDPPTPTSAAGILQGGYRSDMISNYNHTLATEPMSPAALVSPRISHEIPCFFSPRNTPQSPLSTPLYSPHLFRITEQRRSSGYYMRYSSKALDLTMRAFMRAIGLGGLFRRSAASSSASAATASTAVSGGGSFRVITLEQFEKMTVVPSPDNAAAFEARRSSSVIERPQFLFFCGSDKSAFPSGALPKAASPSNSSTLAARLAQMNFPTPAQPAIDHHMPVFFMPPLSPSSRNVGSGFSGY